MSSIRGGYNGRVLRVDLTTGQIWSEATPDPEMWLGARGWSAYYAWTELPPGVGAYDPENLLTLMAGPLVGTGAPASGRLTVSSIGPRGYPEEIWTSASMGGYLGAEIKFAGYDGIVIRGQAPAPCYLLIEDDKVSLKDAADLWGQGVFGTQQTLKARHTPQHQIAAIGPAGEQRVRFASIIHRLANAVGNGGFGGVMGSKNLKAICVRGTRGVPIADPERFLAVCQDVWQLSRGGIGCIGQIDRGYPMVACSHACSVRCGTRIGQASGEVTGASGPRMVKCVNDAIVHGSHPAYRGTHTDGHELYVPQPPGLGELGLDLGNLVEDMGMTAWFYDTWYRYLGGLVALGIHDLLGQPIELDSPAYWYDLITRVAHRDGIGAEIAEDLIRFHDKHAIGPRYLVEFLQSAGSRGHAWHRDGRAMEPHPSPFWEHSALLYATATRDVTPSTHGFFFINYWYDPTADYAARPALRNTVIDLTERLYGSREAILPGMTDVEKSAIWHQHRAIIKDSLGMCDWVYPILRRTLDSREEMMQAMQTGVDAVFGDPSAEARLLAACSGLDISIETMQQPVAERIHNLERLIDMRNHGRTRQGDEIVIDHYQWQEKTDSSRVSLDADEFRQLLDRYYAERGWDAEGAPTESRLEALGLGQLTQPATASVPVPDRL